MNIARKFEILASPAISITVTCLILFCFSARSQDSKARVSQDRSQKPNIIFIYTDDQRYDAIGFIQEAQGARARFPWFKTPNMDRIAKEGVYFENAFVVNSLCSPSRAAMLTGRYNHINGVTNNHSELPDTAQSYATVLSKAGYTTAFIGKWHMARQQGPRHGFDYSFSFIGQGRYMDCQFQLNGSEMVDTKGWVDEISTDTAIAFIKRNRNTPFLVSLAYKSSHYPWVAPEKYAHAFDHVEIRKPDNEKAPPPYLNKMRTEYEAPPRPAPKSDSWTENNDTIIRKYFSVLAAIDENVGRILNLLDSLGLAENTIVVYSSDNGYFLGEHNLSDKRSAYEESIRVPLLVRYPARLPRGKTVSKMVLNVDIPATFVASAGQKKPAGYQGESWMELAEGKPVKWRTSFFYEYYYETPYHIPTIIAERTETAKLIKYPGQEDWSELYDLKKDPQEKRNLYNDKSAAALKARMTALFKRDSAAVQFTIPDFADKRLLDEKGRYIPPAHQPPVFINKPRN
jgi:arylsulfatase A-like enzyme